jgi:hypothetical protein
VLRNDLCSHHPVTVQQDKKTKKNMSEVIVHRQLGAGCFGRVYLVQIGNAWRAMKMLNTSVDARLTIEQLSEINTAAILGDAPTLSSSSNLCYARFFIASETDLYAFMDYVPWTLKDVRPFLAEVRPQNEYGDLLSARQHCEEQVKWMSDSQQVKHEQLNREMDHTPTLLVPGTRLVFEGIDVAACLTDTTTKMRFHVTPQVHATPPPTIITDKDGDVTMEKEAEAEAEASHVVHHPQQDTWQHMLRRALDVCRTPTGWNAFCWSVGLQLTQAVCDLEARGLLHSDLKSSNVGVLVEEHRPAAAAAAVDDENNDSTPISRGFVSNGVVVRLVLLDMGATRMLHRPFSTASLPTPRCCPVELLVNRKPSVQDNLKVDTWAIGTIWGSVFCGRAFFFDETSDMVDAYPGLCTFLFGSRNKAADKCLSEKEKEHRSTLRWMYTTLLHRGLARFEEASVDNAWKASLAVLEPDSMDEFLERLPAYTTDLHPDMVKFWARTLTYHAVDRVTARTLLREMLAWTHLQRHLPDKEEEPVVGVVAAWDDPPGDMVMRRSADWSDHVYMQHWRDRTLSLPALAQVTNLPCLLGTLLPQFVSSILSNAGTKLEACMSVMCDEATLLNTIDLMSRVITANRPLPVLSPVQLFLACLVLTFRAVRKSETWTLSSCFATPDTPLLPNVKQAMLCVLACVDGCVDMPSSYEYSVQNLVVTELVLGEDASLNMQAVTHLTHALILLSLLDENTEQHSSPSLRELFDVVILLWRSSCNALAASSKTDENSDEKEEEDEEDEEDEDDDYFTIEPTERQKQLSRTLSRVIDKQQVFLTRFVRASFAATCHDHNYQELQQSLEALACA